MSEIVERTATDVVWPFHDSGRPYIKIGAGRHGGRNSYIDPFPCYPHDLSQVQVLAEHVEKLWPVPWRVIWNLLHFEELGRTNGWTQMDPTEYENGRAKSFTCSVALTGKRIPIHPAVTIYLVAHEYGHIVENAIAQKRGLIPDTDAILPEYAAMRGIPDAKSYGGGTWHLNVQEVFADDFRILVAGCGPEYWPHPNVPRPEDVPEVVEWWTKAKQECVQQEGVQL